jgi:hypothetical protein
MMSTFQNAKFTFAQVEQMLNSIQPEPSSDFHQRMAKMPWEKQIHPGTKSRMRRYGFSAAIFALLLIVTFFFVTPVGSAIAKDILQFFTRSDSDVKTIPTQFVSVPPPTPTAEPLYGLALVPAMTENPRPTATLVTPQGLSPDEAEKLAGFDLFEPSNLPRDYNLTQVDYDAEKQVVTLWFKSPRGVTGEFILVEEGKNLIQSEIGASAKVEYIPVGDTEAEFVKGGWFSDAGSNEEKWYDDMEVYNIRWKVQDISIHVMITLNDVFMPAYITRDEMAAFVQSIVQCPTSDSEACNGAHASVSHMPKPPADGLDMADYSSISEIEPWTKFDILEPSLLPEGIPFSHVWFNPKLQQVWISCGSFAEDLMHSQGPTLFIYENLVTGGSEIDESLYPVEAIEKVTVNEIPATLVKGRLESASGSTTSTWKESSDLMLSWVNNGVQYGISFAPGYLGGEQLSTENIIRIAESLH